MPAWSSEMGAAMQVQIDKIFKEAAMQENIDDDAVFQEGDGVLAHLKFSFTLSDPGLKDCPLIGCSDGFSELTGYTMEEIIGRNCRFLVDPVPQEHVENSARMVAREFCIAVKDGEMYTVPDAHREPWMPIVHRDDGIFCIQTNARKDACLFKNLFHLKKIELDEKVYIVGLQTEMPIELWDEDQPEEKRQDACRAACRACHKNMGAAEQVMAKHFWFSSPMRRQEDGNDEDDGFV
ncbi:unnamed protein product [Polarella glacialis]|uniref:PAS domain-containing protein n=1 Tax=Polarella glacialis TaxID=89957 RepID=A0A813G2C6_POLGL|nr:unnamed protein product [Polarella glacialis]CAE8654274.1 unnamed protein product [Polarella glacialis]|mmetsp:Transcript_59033/g.95472  ORF Transcript_59033/g.95472 Transcript_59033/m.95472 type:complete len:236 (-) Transcript_59033:8-715(-)|eukprot:CAMPEP_0115092120 /NCGR_PEP_ID=MMETSP0227-20121206/26546_1 /TAXON_ID=89957 /ORGANISM="Polarella glacialis, Strain CCMP 1383" /LENGTH=235 /DNA_ID=CAMNT_0002483817 /DNA_START=117 /DNA_END=824 /DNA_ORIENTATION=-